MSDFAVPPTAPLGDARGAALSFSEVYDSHVDFVWRAAQRMRIGGDDLDDTVQKVFVVVFQKLASFEGRSDIKTWLYGILRRVVKDERRSDQRKHRRTGDTVDVHDMDLPASSKGSDPLRGALRQEAARLVERIIMSLSDERREVFMLAELEGVAPGEIATVLGQPREWVYATLRLARTDFSRLAAAHRPENESEPS